MEEIEVFKDPIPFTEGINLSQLLTSASEFQIDVDFKSKKRAESLLEADVASDSDESDIGDAYKNLEESTDKLMLASPEYHSFDEIAKTMTDCVPSGTVKMLIIEEGDGALVPVDAEVTIHYAAYWEKCTIPFDSTLTMNYGTPMRVCLGRGKIIPGLEVGLTMVRGPKARFHLLLQPEASWGCRGALPRVKPEPALFVINLYDVRDVQAGARFNDLPKEEQRKFQVTMKTVKSLHTHAKDLFSKRKYSKAIKEYQQSLNVLTISNPNNSHEENEVKKLKVTVYINLAVCYYKMDKPKYVIYMLDNLDNVIDIETHCKGLFYYGRAYERLGKNEDALVYYKKALLLEPRNKEIGRALAELDSYIKKSAVCEKAMWQNAFQSVPDAKKEVFNVDKDFEDGVREMCQDMAGRDDYATFDLPTGLSKDEIKCIECLIKDFDGLVLNENCDGKNKKYSIIRQITSYCSN